MTQFSPSGAVPVQNYRHTITPAEIRGFIGTDAPLFLELGCNDGSDSLQWLKEFPQIELHCFEPDPRPIARFKAQVNDVRCQLHELAIAATDGELTFHQSGGTTKGAHLADWDLSGSIHPPTGHLTMSPWCTFTQQLVVPARRLDSWAAQHLNGRNVDFLFADVQGAEHDVIMGGRETLARTRYLYSEFYNRPMYAGQCNLDALLAMLGPTWQLLAIYEGCNFLVRNTRV